MNLQAFMAQNVEQLEVRKEIISKRFKDEEGKPAKWKFGAIDGERDAALRKACTKKMPVPGKKNVLQPELDVDLYVLKLTTATIKHPDLNNAELQNSYGVMGAEQLLVKMLTPGELNIAKTVAQEVNGFDDNFDDLVEEAKN